jgi:pimeloyl-ACP methyl ester carboxylesterase
MTTRWVACGPLCAMGLLFLAGCATPVSIERIGARAAYRELRANVLTANDLSQSTRNVLRRWVLSESYDSDPEGAIMALHAIVVDGRGDEDELFSLAGMAFLRAERAGKPPPTQLASIDAYRPGRMPVIFVHGTASSVGRWADMVNDLLADPRIRDRFQFWFFTYESGNPVLYSSALLRQAIRDAVYKLDPAGTDPALPEMVIIGHSQGGLLAKALVVHSGDQLWSAVANKPLDQVRVLPEQRDLLGRLLFIEPLPNVRRVIFIATPHGGSYLTERSVTGLVKYFLTLPLTLAEAGYDLATQSADDFKVDPRELRSGSLFSMSPRNPVSRTMSSIPVGHRAGRKTFCNDRARAI